MSRSGASRSANGRSSIYQGSDGWWHGYVTMGTKPDGKPDRRHRRGRTRSEVTDKVLALEAERAKSAGRASSAGPLKVGQWLEEWLAMVERTRKPNTYLWYESLIRCHAQPLGSVTLAKLTVRQVDDLLDKVARDSSPARSKSLHRCLRSAFSVAVKRGLIVANPCSHAAVPRVVEPKVTPFTIDETRLILSTATERGEGLRWALALGFGVRQGEALGLRWADVDWEASKLRVSNQIQRVRWRHGCGRAAPDHKPMRCPLRQGGGWALETTKTNAGQRVLVMPDPLMGLFREHRRAQVELKLAAGAVWMDYDFVFCRPDGHPLHPTVDYRNWQNLLGAAGVRNARLHDARHTAATTLLTQAVNPRVVMDMMGWSQQSMLVRYQHVLDDVLRDASDRVTEALWGAR